MCLSMVPHDMLTYNKKCNSLTRTQTLAHSANLDCVVEGRAHSAVAQRLGLLQFSSNGAITYYPIAP